MLPALNHVVPQLGARREVILFDAHADPVLRSIIEETRAALASVSCTPDAQSLGCHRQLSLVVAGRLGGPQPTKQDLSSPSTKHIETLQLRSRTVVVPIGQIFIGNIRHRALLYKYLADIFGMKCRVMKGRFYANNDDDARVVVDVNNGEEYEIDLMTRPGTWAPLERRLALRASSREVAGTDVFSRASSVGGSTVEATNTAPASRSQSDAAHIDSLQAIAAAADAFAAQTDTAAATTAKTLAAIPEPVATPGPPIEAGLPSTLQNVPSASILEQAMQLAAAAAMGQDFSGGGVSGSSGSGGLASAGSLPSPFANAPSLEAPQIAPNFTFEPAYNSVDNPDNPSRHSAPQPRNPSPYDNPSAQGWPGQPAGFGFGSPMPSQSVRSSAPYMYSTEFTEPVRLSMGRQVSTLGGAAGGTDVQVEEMGPAALISDASGQQYILQPVRASMDYSHMRPMDSRPSIDSSHSGLGAGAAAVAAMQQHRGDGSGVLGGGGGGGSSSNTSRAGIAFSSDLYNGNDSLPPLPPLPTSQTSAVEMLKQANSRGLQPLAENAPLDRQSGDSNEGAHRYSQPVPHNHQYQYQSQLYYPPVRSSLPSERGSLPDPGLLSSSLNSNGGGGLSSGPSLAGVLNDPAALQWAAMHAAGSNGGAVAPSTSFAQNHQQTYHQQQQQQQQYNQQQYNQQQYNQPYTYTDPPNLDNLPYSNPTTDMVSKLYLDSIRTSSVRMSVPLDLEARQALLNLSGSGVGSDVAAAAVAAVAEQSGRRRTSVDMSGVKMYTPFEAIDGTLGGSGSETLSDSSKGPVSPRRNSLKDKAAIAAHAGAEVAHSARAPSVAHNALPDLRDFKHLRGGAMSPSSISSFMSGGDGYLASLDSRDLVDDGWEINADELQLGTRIGIGSYGEVYRGQWRQTDVAIKVFLDQELGARMLESFRKEVAIMKKLRHPNIVQFMGACSKPPNLCIVTQYVSRGSLFKLLHRSEANPINMDERRRLQMALDVARGMNYLHTCRPPVIHRDLKSPNLLVDKDMTVKVCDFGLSRVRHATVLSAKSQAGTPEWTAPEVLQGKPCNEASDVYSFGVILWELHTGEEPWTDKSAMQVVGAVGFANERLPVPEGMKPGLADLMQRCFGPSEDRPSFSEIISILKRQVNVLITAGSAARSAAASNKSSGDMVG
jgi:hypothetical protein